eukprot:gene8394-219_t
MTDQKKLVWLDCDPGHDDAMAIILAGHNDKIELLGISTVCGNQTVEKTTLNALKTCHVSGLDHIDVVKGQHQPLVAKVKICPEIHGESGLDGPEFPKVERKPVDEKAVNYMYKVISKQKQKVHIVATAQLTNIALLLSIYPEVKSNIDTIVFMGGAIGMGNTSPGAEFNIECDPEAAKIVMESGLNIVMVPIEVTHHVLVTKKILKRLQDMNSKFSNFVKELLLFFQDSYLKTFNFGDPPLHDPCAVAYVVNPDLFETQFMRVDVDTFPTSYGRTNCDLYSFSKLPKNVTVALKIDVEKFWNLMFDSFEKTNAISILNK